VDAGRLFSSVYRHELKQFLTEGHHTQFNAMREQMRLLSSLSRKVSYLPQFYWNDDYSVVQMNGVPIQMSKLVDMTAKLLQECERLLQRALQGLSFPDFDAHVARCTDPDDPENWLRDDLRNTSVGYSFVADERNGLHRFKNTFLAALLNDKKNPTVAARFCLRNVDGTLHIKRC
jgi:hypothetical protein